jgi:chromosome segregation ATPase
MSGSAELITNEVRRLVLTCKHLQAELEQSIPKKTHQEIVAKLEESIESQNAELEKTKNELDRANALSSALNSIEEYLSKQGNEITSQSELMKAFSSKIGEKTVPQDVYDQSLAQNKELYEKYQKEIAEKNSELGSIEAKNHELLERIAQMVPRSEYLAIQSHLTDWMPRVKHEEEVQKLREQTVPREQFDRIETKVNELETQLSNSVPRSDFERLMKEIITITNDALTASELENQQQVSQPAPSPEASEIPEQVVAT